MKDLADILLEKTAKAISPFSTELGWKASEDEAKRAIVAVITALSEYGPADYRRMNKAILKELGYE